MGAVLLSKATAPRTLWAIVALLLAAAPAIVSSAWLRLQTEVAAGAVAQSSLLNSDALGPLIDTVAEFVSDQPGDLTLRAVAEKAVGSLLLLFSGRSLRAVVFTVEDDNKGMDVLAYSGRSDRPTGFRFRTDKGRAVLASLNSAEPTIENAMSMNSDSWGGSGDKYESFVSARIESRGSVYGMLNVDSREKGVFDESDGRVVELTARVLTVAYLADLARRRSGVAETASTI